MTNSVINIQQKIKDRDSLLSEKMIDVSTICSNSIDMMKGIIEESNGRKDILKIKMMLKIISRRLDILNDGL